MLNKTTMDVTIQILYSFIGSRKYMNGVHCHFFLCQVLIMTRSDVHDPGYA